MGFSIEVHYIGSLPPTATATTMGHRGYNSPHKRTLSRTVTMRGNEPKYIGLTPPQQTWRLKWFPLKTAIVFAVLFLGLHVSLGECNLWVD